MIPAKENLIQFLIFNLIFAMLKPINKHRAIRLQLLQKRLTRGTDSRRKNPMH